MTGPPSRSHGPRTKSRHDKLLGHWHVRELLPANFLVKCTSVIVKSAYFMLKNTWLETLCLVTSRMGRGVSGPKLHSTTYGRPASPVKFTPLAGIVWRRFERLRKLSTAEPRHIYAPCRHCRGCCACYVAPPFLSYQAGEVLRKLAKAQPRLNCLNRMRST